MKFKKLLPILLFGAILSGCGSDNDDVVAPASGTNDPTSGPSVEYITIPEFGPDDNLLDMRATNNGLYFLVQKEQANNTNATWIYRMKMEGPTPDWYIHKDTAFLYGYLPNSFHYEKPDEFSVTTWSWYNYSSINANNGAPFFSNKIPAAKTVWGAPDFVVTDRSTYPTTWIITEGEVLMRLPNGIENYTQVPNTASPGGFDLVEPDDDGDQTALWAARGNKLYKISSSGVSQVAEFTQSGSATTDQITKIRVINDKVYVGTYSNIYEVTLGQQPTTLVTYANIRAFGVGGDFATDGGYIFTSDGTKLDVTFNKVTDIFPPAPNSSNQQAYLDYMFMKTDFQSMGYMEVATDHLKGYIYGFHPVKRKIMAVKKFY